MVAEGLPADAILTSVLDRSGYLSELHDSKDPQDETRLENLRELITVAREFVSGVAALTRRRGRAGRRLRRDRRRWTPVLDPETDLAAGAAEPDDSLGAFLERVALVADSDQIPDSPDAAAAGVVTLMTLHTAKGLEFDTVFLTGCEDGVFPHQRALTDPQGAGRGAPAGLRRHHPGPAAALPHPGHRPLGVGDARSTTRPAGSWPRCPTT